MSVGRSTDAVMKVSILPRRVNSNEGDSVVCSRGPDVCESACVRARGRRALAGDAPAHASAPDSLSIAP